MSKSTIAGLQAEIDRLNAELAAARKAVATLRDYADETDKYWDVGQGAKIGKRLRAMAGQLVYDAAITEALREAADAAERESDE